MLPDRDSPRYPWDRKPADHNPAGLFVDGPQDARSCLQRLIPPTHCREAAPTPTVARSQQAMKRQRARDKGRDLQRLLRALMGQPTRVTRPRPV